MTKHKTKRKQGSDIKFKGMVKILVESALPTHLAAAGLEADGRMPLEKATKKPAITIA